MASAGGHWAKSNYKGHEGQMVFLPAIKEGGAFATQWVANKNEAIKTPVEGPKQGNLIVHKNLNDMGGYVLTHIPTGLAVNSHYSSKEAATLAMYKLNSTGIKWAKITGAESMRKSDLTLMNTTASKYTLSFKKSQALNAMKEAGIKMPKAGKAKATPQAKPKKVKVEEAPKENSLFGL